MGLINATFKDLFKQGIDAILEQQALTTPCVLKFNNATTTICGNCLVDPMLKVSSNLYNGTGPIPFQNGKMCPVCMGIGMLQNNTQTVSLYMALIFDSKYFMNISNKTVRIPDNTIQSICSMANINSILNANELVVTNITTDVSYERSGSPTPCGFGSDYLVTTWTQK